MGKGTAKSVFLSSDFSLSSRLKKEREQEIQEQEAAERRRIALAERDEEERKKIAEMKQEEEMNALGISAQLTNIKTGLSEEAELGMLTSYRFCLPLHKLNLDFSQGYVIAS